MNNNKNSFLSSTFSWILIAVLSCTTAIIAARVLQLQLQFTFADEQIETFIVTKSRALRGELTNDHAIKYIAGYYLPGTKLPSNSPASRLVERVRFDVIEQLEATKVHLKEVGNNQPAPPKNE